MSQQQMYSSELSGENPNMTRYGYEGTLSVDNYVGSSSGQKISARTRFAPPTPHQRLVLALVSVVSLLVAFCIVVVVMAMIPSQIVLPVTDPITGATSIIKDNSAWQHMISILLTIALLICGVLVLSINLLFNLFHRRHEDGI